MKARPKLSTLAGIAAALAGAAWLPFFYVYLFTSRPSNSSLWQSAFDQVAFDLSSESPNALLMAVWYCIPFAWFALGAFFFAVSRFAHLSALVAVGFALVLALASSAIMGWGSAFLFCLPFLYGVAHLRHVEPLGSTLPESQAR
jgi:hypothetical protein